MYVCTGIINNAILAAQVEGYDFNHLEDLEDGGFSEIDKGIAYIGEQIFKRLDSYSQAKLAAAAHGNGVMDVFIEQLADPKGHQLYIQALFESMAWELEDDINQVRADMEK